MPDQWEITPNLSDAVASQGVADSQGGIAYSGISDSSTAGEIAFQGPTADFINYGLVNGAFAQGPADPASNIEPVNNPLPYWYGPVQVSGGAVTAAWVTSSSGPSGQYVLLTINPGAASDEGYIEQIVPFGGSSIRTAAHYVRVGWTGGITVASTFVRLQYLTVTGATTGSEYSGTWSAGAFNTAAVPADAYYVRIRVGVTRGAIADATSASFALTDVRLDRGPGRLVLAGANTDVPTMIENDDGAIYFRTTDETTNWLTLDPNASGGRAISLGDGSATVDTGVYRAAANVLATDDTIRMTEAAAPGTPAANTVYLYAKSTGLLYSKDDAGTETALGGGSASLSPLILPTVITPSIGATVNDWAPAGLATCNVIVVDLGGASRIITGFSASGFVEGQTFWITSTNAGGGSLTFSQGSASSTSGNRIGAPNSVNYVAPSDSMNQIIYLPTRSAANPFRIVGSVA